MRMYTCNSLPCVILICHKWFTFFIIAIFLFLFPFLLLYTSEHKRTHTRSLCLFFARTNHMHTYSCTHSRIPPSHRNRKKTVNRCRCCSHRCYCLLRHYYYSHHLHAPARLLCVLPCSSLLVLSALRAYASVCMSMCVLVIVISTRETNIVWVLFVFCCGFTIWWAARTHFLKLKNQRLTLSAVAVRSCTHSWLMYVCSSILLLLVFVLLPPRSFVTLDTHTTKKLSKKKFREFSLSSSLCGFSHQQKAKCSHSTTRAAKMTDPTSSLSTVEELHRLLEEKENTIRMAAGNYLVLDCAPEKLMCVFKQKSAKTFWNATSIMSWRKQSWLTLYVIRTICLSAHPSRCR